MCVKTEICNQLWISLFLYKYEKQTLMEHMKIDNMRDNNAINNRPPKADKNWKSPYVRKGGTGGWKNYFTNESTLKKFDEWIKKNNVDELGNQIEGLRFE